MYSCLIRYSSSIHGLYCIKTLKHLYFQLRLKFNYMSSKRARLIRPDNFKRLSYYDVYNYTQSVKSNTLSTSSTYINKKSNYINSNRRSLKYSVALKGLKTSSTKSSQKGLSYLYPMYMSPFLNDRYDINYCNSYNIYNKVKKLKFLSCTMNKGSDILVTRRKKKH